MSTITYNFAASLEVLRRAAFFNNLMTNAEAGERILQINDPASLEFFNYMRNLMHYRFINSALSNQPDLQAVVLRLEMYLIINLFAPFFDSLIHEMISDHGTLLYNAIRNIAMWCHLAFF